MAFVVVALQTTRQLWNLTRSARLVPFGIPPWRLARLFWWLSSPGPPFLASILNLSVSGVLYLESYGHGVQIWYIVEFNMTLYARSTSEGYKRLIRLGNRTSVEKKKKHSAICMQTQTTTNNHNTIV